MRSFRVLSTALLITLASCDSGRDTLLANLQSTRPEERALAVKRLAEKAKPEDLVLFTSAAKDPAAIVRGEAALALGKSQDERVVDLLGELLGDDSEEVQANAAMALAEIKTDKAKAYLTSQYARRGRSTRQAIVQALKAANVPGAMAGVVSSEAKSIWDRNLKALTDGTLPEQVAAAEELGKSGRAEAVTRLTGLLKDSQVMLAAAAARGLGNAGDKRAVPAITELLKENFPELRQAACGALARLQDASALPKLQELALEKSTASTAATNAILALPPAPEIDKALCAIVLDGSVSDAIAAGRALRTRTGCPAELFTERWPKQGGQAAVLQAAIALGPSLKDWLPKLQPLLQNADQTTKLSAIAALGAIGDASAAPALQKIYDAELKTIEGLRTKWIPTALPTQFAPGFDGTQEQDAQGAQTQAKFKDLFRRIDELNAKRAKDTTKRLPEQKAPVEIVDDASDEQLAVFAAVIRALGEVKAPGAQEILKARLSDPSRRVRQAAYFGLIGLGGEALELARPALFDPDRDVQTSIAWALARAGEQGQSALAKSFPEIAGDKMYILEALDETGVPATVSAPLIQILKEGGPEAALAARLLGKANAKDAAEPMTRYLQDPASVGRREALVALGRVGDTKAADVIAKDLYHDSPDVRAAAAEALGNVGTTAQGEALDALKGDYYRRVRELAEAAIPKLQAPAPEAKK